jgi:CheY-like chemotaxis protein
MPAEAIETELRVNPRPSLANQEREKVEVVARRVLVVDDDAATREALADILALWGYEPVLAGSAEEAVFASRHKVDAALVDIFLPGRSGEVVLAKLREKFPDALLVGMSALSDYSMVRRCKGKGADLFVAKPVDAAVLSQVLQSEHHSWQ